MNETTCSNFALRSAGGAFFSAFSISFIATTHGEVHQRCADHQVTAQIVASSSSIDLAGSASSALGRITARDIEEGERAVREGRWISLADLRRELRSQVG